MRYRYRTIEFDEIDIHLRTLRDTNEFSDPDGVAEALGISPSRWPIFGVVWASSLVLASVMVERDVTDCRILEVGCGLGLASMVLNQRGADITATDQHPQAEAFLRHNAALNGEDAIPFERSDWCHEDDTLGLFDLIIGSDLLYDREQAEPLSRFIDNHTHQRATVILVDPGRGQAGRFARHLGEHGFAHSRRHALDDTSIHYGRQPGPREQIHTFERG